MLKIGLTGNIAAGKSEAEQIIKKNGYKVIDLDIVSHDLYNDKIIKSGLVKAFKTLNRKEIAKIVFSSGSEKEKLDNIFFPRLKEFISDYFKKNSKEKAVIISGALIFEAGYEDLFDKIIYIEAPYEIRLKRLEKRNNISEGEAKKRMNCQKDNSRRADYIIRNDKDLKNLEENIIKIFKELTL